MIMINHMLSLYLILGWLLVREIMSGFNSLLGISLGLFLLVYHLSLLLLLFTIYY